ncbi:uncharacterized protein J3D65DRAFT_71853 [Phyllosticta citribraziliensis]|uniref:Uncharacterized protein n=1 Tax=Phyllosticta citribraziliensis TaxID=989973 RepID=A0ABR1LD33_9PEZI
MTRRTMSVDLAGCLLCRLPRWLARSPTIGRTGWGNWLGRVVTEENGRRLTGLAGSRSSGAVRRRRDGSMTGGGRGNLLLSCSAMTALQTPQGPRRPTNCGAPRASHSTARSSSSRCDGCATEFLHPPVALRLRLPHPCLVQPGQTFYCNFNDHCLPSTPQPPMPPEAAAPWHHLELLQGLAELPQGPCGKHSARTPPWRPDCSSH